MNQCIVCQKETKNPKFCSRSCSTSNNNRNNPRKVKTKKCKMCETLVLSDRMYCKNCRPKSNYDSGTTIAQIKGRRKYQVSSQIRDIARRIYQKSDKLKVCLNCGYDKYYEVAHIKAINSYPPDTLLSEVNNINNLVALCPTCHWEFDNLGLALPRVEPGDRI